MGLVSIVEYNTYWLMDFPPSNAWGSIGGHYAEAPIMYKKELAIIIIKKKDGCSPIPADI